MTDRERVARAICAKDHRIGYTAAENWEINHPIYFAMADAAIEEIWAPINKGFSIVPNEPTEEMMQAGLYQSSHDSEWQDVYSVWVDMVSAAALRPEAQDGVAEAHGKLWAALAEIIEMPGQTPNATVRRMARRAEEALIADTVSDVKPEPRFALSQGGK